jgi:hypothetical protein
VYRIPDTPFGVIVLMDFLNRHRTSFRLRLSFASNPRGYKFTVRSLQFAVRLGRAYWDTFEHKHSEMGLMRPIGLMDGSRRLMTNHRERRTANCELRIAS